MIHSHGHEAADVSSLNEVVALLFLLVSYAC